MYDPVFMHFFGLRRSGNHAVIHWLWRGLEDGDKHSVLLANSVADALNSSNPYSRLDYLRREIERSRPDYVILGYEDCSFARRHDLKHYKKLSSGNSRQVLLLRSFPNLIASQIQRRHNLGKAGALRVPIWRLSLAAIRDLWVEYAKTIASEKEKNGFVSVLYDRWFNDRKYRDEIGNQLGFANRDTGLDYVPEFGEGSSFDGISFQGEGSAMSVLGRWRMFKHDEESMSTYKSLTTPEVVRFNQELFGFDPLQIMS
jgi:hypothetical protein